MPRKRKVKMPAEPTPILAIEPVEPETPEVIKAREDAKHKVTLQVSRDADGSNLSVYIRAPMLAAIVRKMATGHFAKTGIADIYKPILEDCPDEEGKVNHIRTRPGIKGATKHLVGGTDFQWGEAPRAILLYNADALEAGYTLKFKPETPVPVDLIKRWGKQFMDGCSEIITNARPFRMSWVASPVPEYAK